MHQIIFVYDLYSIYLGFYNKAYLILFSSV